MKNPEKKDGQRTHYLPLGMSIGIGIGMLVGAMTEQIAIGVCIGIGLGMSAGAVIDRIVNRDKPEA